MGKGHESITFDRGNTVECIGGMFKDRQFEVVNPCASASGDNDAAEVKDLETGASVGIARKNLRLVPSK